MEKASKSLVKELKKQKRENDFLLFLDNPKIIRDAINSGLKPLIAFVTKKTQDCKFDCKTYIVEDSILKELTDVKTPQDLCVVLEYKPESLKVPKKNFLILDGIQDPGNTGTLIRSALASGMESVFILSGVNPTNNKLVRSSAGAIFNIPIYSMDRNDFIAFAKNNKLLLVYADMKGENIFNFQTKKSLGIVVGNEGNGVSNDIRKISYKSLSIPMSDKIESLNAAVSGSIIMFEINKNNI